MTIWQVWPIKELVKRAYKELPDTQADITQEESGFLVQMGDVSCRLALPLGSSQCKLRLPQHLQAYHHCGAENAGLSEGAGRGSAGWGLSEGAGRGRTGWGRRRQDRKPGRKRKYGVCSCISEVASYPLEKARKVMGSRRFQSLIECARLGMAPKITVTSVITVEWPEDGTR